jgi:hypothetical protein
VGHGATHFPGFRARIKLRGLEGVRSG